MKCLWDEYPLLQSPVLFGSIVALLYSLQRESKPALGLSCVSAIKVNSPEAALPVERLHPSFSVFGTMHRVLCLGQLSKPWEFPGEVGLA